MPFDKIVQNTRFITGYIVMVANFLTLAIIYLGKVIKSRSFKVSLIAFIILVSLAVAVPMMLDNSLLKFKIEQKVSEISKSNFSINGKLEIKFIPYPVIIANDVVMRNFKQEDPEHEIVKYFNFYANSVTSKIPLFGISSQSFTSEIIINDAVLESYQDDLYKKNNDSLFSQKLKQNKIELTDVENINMGQGISGKIFSIDRISADEFNILNIPKITFINGSFIRYDGLLREKKIDSINGFIKLNYSTIKPEIEFVSNKIKSKIVGLVNIGNNYEKISYLEILSPAILARLEGNFIEPPKNIYDSTFNGKLFADISELKSFYGSYINNYDIVFNKLGYNSRDIKISADITNITKELSIDNILINSSIINGEGQASLNLSRKIPIMDLSLNLKNLDLDSIWSGEALTLEKLQSYIKYFPNKTKVDEASSKVKEGDEKENILTEQMLAKDNQNSQLITTENRTIYDNKQEDDLINENEKLDIEHISNNIKNIDFTAEIKVDNIKYLNGEIKDGDVYITISKGGQIMILPLIFKTPGGGLFRVSGVFNNNSEVPKFVGKIDTKGESLKDVFRWFNFSAQNLKLDKLEKYSIYSDVLLLPTTTIFNNFYLNLNDGSSEFLGNIKIVRDKSKSRNIALDLYGTYFNVDDFFLTSGRNVYLSPGSFLKKVLWLNNITSRNNLKLKFDRLIYKGETFNNQSIALRIGKGYFEVSDMKLNSINTTLEANLILDISSDTPKFSARIFADKFTYDSTTNNIEIDSSFNQDVDLKPRDFFDQLFALPSLKGFDGIVNIYLKKVLIDKAKLDEVKIYGELRDGSIKNSEINCKFLDGNLKYDGLINVGSLKVLSGTLTATNVDLGATLLTLTNQNNISAKGNLSAAFNASAAKKEEFFRKLSAKIIFAAKPVEIKNYGLSDLIKEMFVASIKKNKIDNPESIIGSQGAITKFSEASGSIDIIDENNASYRVDLKAPALNSIFSGSFSIKDNQANGLLNSLFLTGNRKKQIPINVATSIIYKDNNITQITNLDQVRQYFGLKTIHTTPKLDDQDNKQDSKELIDFSKDFESQQKNDEGQSDEK